MEMNVVYSRLELEEDTHRNKATLLRLLNSLIQKGVVIKEGQGSATTYRKIRWARFIQACNEAFSLQNES